MIAIVTRRLLEEHPLLVDKVEMGMSKSIRPSDRTNLTTLVTLYDVVDVVLRDRKRGWEDYKRWRPSEREVEEFYAKASGFWDDLCVQFKALRELRDSAPNEQVAGRHRSRDGGHLLFRPVGLMLIGHVVCDLRSSEGMSTAEAIETVGLTPTNLAEVPWTGLLWDNMNGRMLTAKENQRVARQLLFCSLGGDIAGDPFNTSEEDLRRELAGMLNRDVQNVDLSDYLIVG